MTRSPREPTFLFTQAEFQLILKYLLAARRSDDVKYIHAAIDMLVRELETQTAQDEDIS